MILEVLEIVAAGLVGSVVGALSSRAIAVWRPAWRQRFVTGSCGVVAAALWWVLAFDSPAMFLLGWWCAVLSAIDLGSKRLPNLLTGAGAVASGIGLLVCGQGRAAVVGAGVLFGAYLLVHLLAPLSFGAGDVKLAWTLGAVSAVGGVDTWTFAALLAPVITGFVGLGFMAVGRREVRVPHGPAMCGTTLLALAAVLT